MEKSLECIACDICETHRTPVHSAKQQPKNVHGWDPTSNENLGDTFLTLRLRWWCVGHPYPSWVGPPRAGLEGAVLTTPGQELTVLGGWDGGPWPWAGRGEPWGWAGQELLCALGATRGQESGQGVTGWGRRMSYNKSARMHLPCVGWEMAMKNPSRFHSLLDAIGCDIDIEIKHTLCPQATEKQS